MVVAEAEGSATGREGLGVAEGAAEVGVLRSQNLGRSAAVGLVADGIFDGVHKGEGFADGRQRNAKVPSLKEARGLAVPVIAAVGCL